MTAFAAKSDPSLFCTNGVPAPWGTPAPIVVIAQPYHAGAVCELTGRPEHCAGEPARVVRFCEAHELDLARSVRDMELSTGAWRYCDVYVLDESGYARRE